MRQSAACALAIVLLLAGCGTWLQSPDVSTSMPPPIVVQTSQALKFSCDGDRSFGADLFAQAGNAESADDQWAPTLREFLRQNADPGFPEHGWHLVAGDASSATFLAAQPGGAGFVEVMIGNSSSRWEVTGSGFCLPAVVLINGYGTADWILDSNVPKPAASDTQFVALVTERACASRQSSEGRVSSPAVLYEADRILVIFGVQPLPGMQECPTNPSTRVVVHLVEPIGTRRLLDGSFWPPHDPTERLN